MNVDGLFNAGTAQDIVPDGDAARQAVDSLRGYAYQVLQTTLAWLDIGENTRLFLEVAEDYALVADGALRAVQVKNTEGTGSVTLNSASIRAAVTNFVDLSKQNPDYRVELHFFTTSEIGTERAAADRPSGMAGLNYWREVAVGEDISPLRAILQSDKFPKSVGDFCKGRDDKTLRQELIERISWDCGKPDIHALRQAAEDRLVVMGRDLFHLPVLEARRLADPLVWHVLKKSITKEPQQRVLTRAKLYEEIEKSTRTSVPRTAVDALLQLTPGFIAALGEAIGSTKQVFTTETNWLFDGTTLPSPQGTIVRVVVESALAESLGAFGAGVLVGATGVGKSTVSRAVACARTGAFVMAAFRKADAKETRHRLDMVFACIEELPSSTLILEDLNFIDDAHVTLSLARVVKASRHRNREIIITCYQRPAATGLREAGLAHGSIVNCPYFSEAEVGALVRIYEGDPDRWGHLSYIVGSGGHPQLTHAVVMGTAARGWPVQEIKDILRTSLSSIDTEATRDAARRSLVSALPEGTRGLLYRLSLTIRSFDRSLALTIGEIPPSVSQAGECMDLLVGPWIESVGRDLFRVSPLASTFGHETLSPVEQRRIHGTIAAHMLAKRMIDASDIDAIMVHAISGKSPKSLAMVAGCVLLAGDDALDALAEHLSIIHVFPTDTPIYPEAPVVSGMLRLVQFKLSAASDRGRELSDIARALVEETRSLPKDQEGLNFEAMAIFTILCTMGIANHLDNWISLLLRLKFLIQSEVLLQKLIANVEMDADPTGSNFLGMLFSIGSVGLTSVARLEHIVNQLDGLDAGERATFLTPANKALSDYSTFIGRAWVAEQSQKRLDAADAAFRYQRMATKTRKWGIPALTLRCSVAHAVMLDEYQDNSVEALAVLEDAAEGQGDSPILSRAMAKIHARRGEHGVVLKIFRSIANDVGNDDPVERALALRDAAISAAKCSEWPQAERWFLGAHDAAKLSQGDVMEILAVGLGADSAVAAFQAGNIGSAITRLAAAIDGLATIDPEATVRSAYCHRVIRHTVLWVKSHIEGDDIKIYGEPIAMAPGTCSNLDPLPAIRDLPLGHIDVVWYLLAQAETAAGVKMGIATTLNGRLASGSIPAMEIVLRQKQVQFAIERFDAASFVDNFTAYIESSLYLQKNTSRLKETFDPLAPERGQLPALNSPESNLVARNFAIQAIVAFGVRCALAGQPEPIKQIEAGLDERLATRFLGKLVFDHWNGIPASFLEELETVVLSIAKVMIQQKHMEPRFFWTAGFRFFEWISKSSFKGSLTAPFADWQRSGWKRITSREPFRLYNPMRTVPRIDEVMQVTGDDLSFVANLLLVTQEAVQVRLGSESRYMLKVVADESAS